MTMQDLHRPLSIILPTFLLLSAAGAFAQETAVEYSNRISITEDRLNEVRTREKNIRLADEGRLDEIPQTGHLKRDPVEWTARYEEVIDEAEREAHEQLKDVPRGMGFCFAYWPEKREALARRGVEWRDPHLMNPHVIFD